MSEFWVSHKKYYCTYCKIYISDDAPSKAQHENGLRHIGNKERFVRNLYKTSEKKKHDQEEEKREIARIDQAAEAAFAQDVGAGNAKAGSSKPPPIASTSSVKPPKPSSPWANYSTAASLGYTDPDAERLAAEAERKRTQGVAGEWETVAPTPDQTVVQERKRRVEEVEIDEEDSRTFKLRKKTTKGLGELWDPGAIPIKLKPKKEEVKDEDLESGKMEQEAPLEPLPKWTSRSWKKPGEDSGIDPQEDEVKLEVVPEPEVPAPLPKAEPEETKFEEPVAMEEPAPEGMFRKRKIGGTRGRR